MDKVDDVVVSTRIRLARNIKKLPFPKRLSGQEEIYSVLMKGVKKRATNFSRPSSIKCAISTSCWLSRT